MNAFGAWSSLLSSARGPNNIFLRGTGQSCHNLDAFVLEETRPDETFSDRSTLVVVVRARTPCDEAHLCRKPFWHWIS
ncbi:hypothetical protein Tco_0652207 [Tanacetum coccineum]|uniref:Secreted protein n=1 Tax=Tanacetum coccineum TaxID=301880 RepID=A0ABQ4WX59_9ASTR